MPYLFTCPHCQAKTEVEDRYSGRSGECYACGSPITLPDFAQTGGGSESAPTAKRPAGALIAAGVVLTVLLCLIAAVIRFGGPSVSRLADARLQNASMKNLEKIASALNAYAVDHGTYPPAALRDDSGRALHSWRVLILPYLGEQETYDQFDLSQPWDSDTNLQASVIMPNVYQHPADNSPSQGTSGYYLITGPNTLFPPTGPLAPDQIEDKSSQTILVIAGKPPLQTALGGWAEPVDLDYSKMNGIINGTAGIEAGGYLKSGVTMATVDGRSHFLKTELPATTFNALVTPNGNEPLADYTLD